MRTTNLRRPPLRYHGGKWRLGPWIISHFPEHRVYVEPFGGGASVLFRKPRSFSEVYNDLDGEIVNVFQVMRDCPGELEQLLRATPYARAEFDLSYEPSDDPLEQARRTVIRSHMGFGSAAVTKAHKTGFRAGALRSGSTPAHDWAKYPSLLASFAARLRGVTLECKDGLEVMLQQDGEESLHYVDPPYVWGTRREGSGAWNDAYRFEMDDDAHRTLAAVLHGLEGAVVLSGYASDLYDLELYADWKRVECATVKSTNDASAPATEVLWMNPAAFARNRGPLFA